MNLSALIFTSALLFSAMPFVDTPIALLTGIIFALTVKHPFPVQAKKTTHFLLQTSVVGLGFGMNAFEAFEAGKQGLFFTIVSISLTIILGVFLGKKLRIDKNTSYLISMGTAVCGGSAIAAISSVIRSNEKQISTALGTVFILNSVALFLFPWVGQFMHLTQHQFGVWAAIAIHDTSSVVGAASRFGKEALYTATTIKLERALWIIPLAFLSMQFFGKKGQKVSYPLFILLFVIAILINTYIPAMHQISNFIVFLSKTGLKLSLFLIGTGLSQQLISSVGIKPFLQGLFLWITISFGSLFAILHFVL